MPKKTLLLLSSAIFFVIVIIVFTFITQQKGDPLLLNKNTPDTLNVQHPIHSFTLKNGLRFFLIKDNRLPIVTHSIWYRVGSVDEKHHETGLAHYLEHLMFKGTQKYPDGQYSKIIAQNGGETNAFTSFDYTAYYVHIARDKLPIIMDLEADRMKNLILKKETSMTELEVVREERKQRIDNNPDNQHSEKEFQALFGDSGYGHPIIGWDDIIKTLTPEMAIEYYQKNYTPSNAVVIITGDISNEEGEELAKKYYSDISDNTQTHTHLAKRCQPFSITDKPIQKRVDGIDDNIKTPTISFLYNTPHINKTFEDIIALDILTQILGGGQNNRLYKTLILEKQKAVWVDASFLPLRYGGLFYMNAMPREGVSFRVIEDIFKQEIDKMQKELVSTEELERAKTQLEAQIIYSRDNQFSYAMQLGRLIINCHTLENMKNLVDIIQSTTAEKIRDVAKRYILKDYKVISTLQNNQKLH